MKNLQLEVEQLKKEVADLKRTTSTSGLKSAIQPILNSFSSFVRFVTGSLEFDTFLIRNRSAKNIPAGSGQPVTGDVLEMAFKNLKPGNSFNHLFIGRSGDSTLTDTNYILNYADRNEDREASVNNMARNGRLAFMVNREGRNPNFVNLDIVDARLTGRTGAGTTTQLIADGSGYSTLAWVASDLSDGKEDVYVDSAGATVILTSSNGTRYKITVSDAGTLGTTAV